MCEKVFFGQEGANVKIISPLDIPDLKIEGDNFEHKASCQEYNKFFKNDAGKYYQIGVIFAGESACLYFRCGRKNIGYKAQFCG